MNRLQALNQLARVPKVRKLKLTVTTPDGKTDSTVAKIIWNKLSEIGGPGLSSYGIYQLKKEGRTEGTDAYGTKYVYELLGEEVNSEEKKDETAS